ncbi:MAG: methyltransferase domain-containing protein [Anaerolineales bacterium]|nr:methyltransferase domain-containing protein [Anaerolineales bacterium]
MESILKRALTTFLRTFFKHLYTTFAWAYDFVAWTTSMGQWRTWQSAALLDLPYGTVLELGHGPGHLLLRLSGLQPFVVGVDASKQMTRIASKRVRAHGNIASVVRARAQRLPLAGEIFFQVVSTFPSEFIFDPDTLAEIWRVLKPGGVAVVVGVAKITGKSIPDRIANWLYRVTGQSGEPGDGWEQPLRRLGFSVHLERVEQPRATVLRLMARKDESSS